MLTAQWSTANALRYARRRLSEVPLDPGQSNKNEFLSVAIERIGVALLIQAFGESEVQISNAMKDISVALAAVGLSEDASLQDVLDNVLESFRESGRSITEW
ncbi:hypothetical protein [Paraburkholderia xenovorans]|uniref:hypothetical protein n=1 Tax=Paraburkholderia xenovorans TaxID=36873 RepID=UPI0015C52B96|nr:hypothetical protein [Paraburkholderia xenovorans]NPT37404.1 hypothetical protein [Paraburkholderia xenovorans]